MVFSEHVFYSIEDSRKGKYRTNHTGPLSAGMPPKALYTVHISEELRNLVNLSELSAAQFCDLWLFSVENKFYWVVLERSSEWQNIYCITILHFMHFVSTACTQKKLS